jgi:hypothetical protein
MPLLGHTSQVLIVVAGESDGLPQRHVIFDGVFWLAFIALPIGHEHFDLPR